MRKNIKKAPGERKIRKVMSLHPRLVSALQVEADNGYGGNVSLLATKIFVKHLKLDSLNINY